MVAILAGAAGFYLSRANLVSPVAEGAAQRLMRTALPDPAGTPQPMSKWRGKVLVVNFWATWCAPCRQEIPALIQVQHKHASNGVQFVGIAIDNAVKVKEFAVEMHIDYPLLIGDVATLALSKELGNRAEVLPFTVVLDRAAKVTYSHVGALTEAKLSEVLRPLLAE